MYLAPQNIPYAVTSLKIRLYCTACSFNCSSINCDCWHHFACCSVVKSAQQCLCHVSIDETDERSVVVTPLRYLSSCRCTALAPFMAWRVYAGHKLMGKAAITRGLHLGRSEVLWSLRHHWWAQSQGQGHHTNNHLEEEHKKRTYLTICLEKMINGYCQSDK